MMESSIDLLGNSFGDTICDIIEYVVSLFYKRYIYLFIYLLHLYLFLLTMNKISDCSDDLSTQTILLESLFSLTAKSLSLTSNIITFGRAVGLVESLVKAAHTPFYVLNNNMYFSFSLILFYFF